MKINFRHGNDGLNDETSLNTAYESDDPGMTIQAGAEDADINVIVKRYGIGPIPMQNRAQPMYGDFSEIPNDYHEALNTINDTNARFEALPPEIKQRFANNPYELITFTRDPKNEEEARNIGLLPKKVTPPPIIEPAKVAAPPAS